jgi:hypothetical protein
MRSAAEPATSADIRQKLRQAECLPDLPYSESAKTAQLAQQNPGYTHFQTFTKRALLSFG